MSMETERRGVPGAAIDATRDRRPGVPMESVPPHPVGAAHWDQPDRQTDPGGVLKRANLPERTRVCVTSVPPRGVSGMMRRAAYRIPDHHTSHWLVLLLADRVDALEHGSWRWMPASLALVGGAAIGLRFRKKR